MTKLKNYTCYKFLVKTNFHSSTFEIQSLQYPTMHSLKIIGTGFDINSYSNNHISFLITVVLPASHAGLY